MQTQVSELAASRLSLPKINLQTSSYLLSTSRASETRKPYSQLKPNMSITKIFARQVSLTSHAVQTDPPHNTCPVEQRS